MATIQVRTREEHKRLAMKILAELGLDLSTAINMYLMQIIRKGGIPFPILTENGYTPEKEQEILDAYEDAKNSKKSFSSAEELMDDILNG